MDTQKNQFTEYHQYLETYKPKITDAMRENLPLAPTHIETQFNTALEYVLFGDDRRLHSILTLLGAELVEGKASEILPTAVAVEFIYRSGLVFEDLLIKNVMRNEKDTLHEKFGQEVAVLVGLGLLNAAYPLVFVNHTGMPENAFAAHAEIVECVGATGFVGGLAIESELVESVGGTKNLEPDSIRRSKDSAIIRLAMRLGAILSGANYLELANLSRFAELFSDAYQLSDNSFELNSKIDEAKRVLIENFPSNEARSSMIQLTESLLENKV